MTKLSDFNALWQNIIIQSDEKLPPINCSN